MVISNFLLLPSVFANFSRLDSFYTISTQRILYVSILFLVSLVPWIDKPWGNTLGEKLHDSCACGIQIGALRSVNTWLYSTAHSHPLEHTEMQSPPRSRVANLPSGERSASASLEGSEPTLGRADRLRLARGYPSADGVIDPPAHLLARQRQ